MKTILITGGTGKIGSTLVAHFLEKEWRVVVPSRTKQGNNQDNLLYINSNLVKPNGVEKLVDYLDKTGVFPDVLVNAARNPEFLKDFSDPDKLRDSWSNEYLLDVIIPYELSLRLSKMTDSRLKNIVNISSIYGIVTANPHLYEDFESQSPINYSVAKAGVIHLTKEMAVRMIKQGIRVNCVSYGGVKGRVDQEFIDRYAKLTPSQKMLEESDLCGAVDFLLSDGASSVIGHNLVVDGGWTLW